MDVTLCGPKGFEDMDRGDRIRACYQHCQHCALRWVMAGRMRVTPGDQRTGT